MKKLLVLNLIVLSLALSACDESTTSETGPCAGVKCSNHGTCTVYGEDPGIALCQCEWGYHEDRYLYCVPDSEGCQDYHCDGHGTCFNQADDGTIFPRCTCDDGYVRVGDIHCVPDDSPDPCEGVTCSGHGACGVVGEEPGLPVCDCDEGYVAVDLTCVVEAGCGDGLVNAEGEECDDGNDLDEDGCTAACLFSCHLSDDCAQDDNECVINECTSVENGMMCAPVPVEGSCDDGDDCTGPDVCADGVCGGEVLPVWYLDADNDSFGDAASPVCAATEPGGTVADATDCCDSVHDAHPLQTQFFQDAYQCGGVDLDLWDYDCNTVVDRQHLQFEACAGATSEAACTAASGWATTTLSIPDCGVQAMYSYCRWVGGVCGVVATQPMRQACR